MKQTWKAISCITVLSLLLIISIPLVSAKGPKPPPPPADPAIAYRIGNSIGVMNEDGSNQAVVFDPALETPEIAVAHWL